MTPLHDRQTRIMAAASVHVATHVPSVDAAGIPLAARHLVAIEKMLASI